MFANQLAIIFEETNNSLEDIEDEIRGLEEKRNANLEPDFDLRQMRELAEQTIEQEL